MKFNSRILWFYVKLKCNCISVKINISSWRVHWCISFLFQKLYTYSWWNKMAKLNLFVVLVNIQKDTGWQLKLIINHVHFILLVRSNKEWYFGVFMLHFRFSMTNTHLVYQKEMLWVAFGTLWLTLCKYYLHCWQLMLDYKELQRLSNHDRIPETKRQNTYLAEAILSQCILGDECNPKIGKVAALRVGLKYYLNALVVFFFWSKQSQLPFSHSWYYNGSQNIWFVFWILFCSIQNSLMYEKV